MTRHVLSGVTFACVEPGLWQDTSGRWVIREHDDKVPGRHVFWTLEDRGQVVEKKAGFWDFGQSVKLRKGP